MTGTAHVRSITLVRHGRTSYNAQHRLQGQIDIPLDAIGSWQVRRTAEALRELYVDRRPDIPNRIVVSSDLGRAMATAHAFADPLGLDVHPDERVRERSFGDWEGISVEELAERYPQDWRLWSEFKGGELKYGAEPKEAVGARGAAALDDWAHRAGADTDLYVFSHGAWIAQTLQTLLGLGGAGADFAGVMGMRNAHWARLIPFEQADGALRWRLLDYNHGPAIADTDQWEHPAL
ncbi:MAG: histidine phosphatase family protein [Bifidobacterium scardovii]|uniref:histidine phosphatase family protein n=1 Tax=Bifidobacterium scardovii TaxID=158787 RepID=UPI0006658662|nr:histidine phosphatase family protein [Bifidobacterium scardovii]MBS6946834.1 histidine phosphatase family protein [Bifidobacterium scardovii]MDU3735541.1 histidine phosphatase family protein [Bifidobacterium scardovii]MDU5297393.1 histidine phosphatase family protein [Bifidobacterium scardovii]MDU5610563.1 histidine phosphatase family protein [Bifidobacterium scardovii]MDU5887004.1 histidine phosphatase family protein [Bifidobacterium scardovii]